MALVKISLAGEREKLDMKLNVVVFTFIAIHLTLGRKVSIPYGVASGLNIYLVLDLALVLDTIFTSLIYFLSRRAVLKLKFLRKIREKIISLQDRLISSNSCLIHFFSHLGKTGIVLANVIPFTGGINVSIPLTHALNLSKGESLFLLFVGNFLGCLFIALGAKGILVWFS